MTLKHLQTTISRMKVRLRDRAGSIQNRLETLYGRVATWPAHLQRFAARLWASGWNRFYWLKYRLQVLVHRLGTSVTTLVLMGLFATSVYFASDLQPVMTDLVGTRTETLASSILALGGALIGATAIVSSLILFAMQVNIGRMPYRMFRRLAADPKLLGIFGGSFALATSVAALPLFLTASTSALVTFVAVWATIAILVMFVHAYRRALMLINPVEQLRLLVQNIDQEFKRWARRARRAQPLFEPDKSENEESVSASLSSVDVPRASYFKINHLWTANAKQAILHANSMSRQYAQRGDHEVSEEALRAVLAINQLYVKTKGKTFFAQNPFLDTGLSTDDFINTTLEHLRQNVRVAVARGDEEQIEQNLRVLGTLVHTYVQIDYASLGASKTHAHLAAGYLASAVESVIPHKLPDVLMEGVRLLGTSAKLFVQHAEPNEIRTMVDKIAVLAVTGAANKDYRPITLAAMEQLAEITLVLLQTPKHDIRFAAQHVRKNVVFAAKLFLAIPSTPLENTHRTFLAPYYSGTSFTSLRSKLTELVNAVINADAENKIAQEFIRNVAAWANNVYQTEKELFEEAIKQRSHFTHDMIIWIEGITELLVALSDAPACSPHHKEELRREAGWLLAVLTWVPNETDAVAFVDNFNLAEHFFDAAMKAHHRDCQELAIDAAKYLIGWGIKAAKHGSHLDKLSRALCGITVFVLTVDDEEVTAELKSELVKQLEKSDLDDATRFEEAQDLSKVSSTLYQYPSPLSRIEHAMRNVDRERLTALLHEFSQLLAPSNRTNDDGSS